MNIPAMCCRALVVALLVTPLVLHAQGAVSEPVAAAISRARTQLDAGDANGARALLDSLVAATGTAGGSTGSSDLAEALYWRAALSEQVADAEKDWRRLIVEVPLSPRVADALLRLAELNRARGRPDAARLQMERLLRDHGDSPARSRALLTLGRTYLDERDPPRACGVLTTLRAELPPAAVELRLQTDELLLQCRGVSAVPYTVNGEPTVTAPVVPPAAPTPTPAPIAPPRDSAPPVARPAPPLTAPVPKPTAPAPVLPTRTAGSGKWSVQVAAYDTRAEAESLVKRLASRAIDARVDGETKPFRVRVGRYATRNEAANALTALKAKGQGGFVTEVSVP